MSHLPIDKMSQPHFNTYYQSSQRKFPITQQAQPVPQVSTSTPILAQNVSSTPQSQLNVKEPTQIIAPVRESANKVPPVRESANKVPLVRDFASKLPPTSLDDQFKTPFSLAQLNPKLPFETNCLLTPESQKCNYQLPPQPIPVQLGGDINFRWNVQTSVFDDCCATITDSQQSSKTGTYQLSGFDPQPLRADQYANMLNEINHFPYGYSTPSAYIDDSSDLIYGELSSQREINQLFARPYKGFFSGAGTRSLDQKDLESALQQGILTNLRQKPCEVTRGTTNYRFQSLPDFGNPQRLQHIIMPVPELGGVVRGGLPTRDFVRRVDYQRRCINRENGFYVNKVPKCGVPPARL